MVMVNLSELDLKDMVDNYFKDEETSELKIKSFQTARRIAEIYCDLPIAQREKLYFSDYLAFNVQFYDSIEEALDDGIKVEEYEIIQNKKLFDDKDTSKEVILIGDWHITLD